MNFSDVIKKSVMEGFQNNDISTFRICIVLGISFIIATYIFFIYRAMTKSTFYSKSFNISTAIIAVVTAGIILAMQSNIVVSLGMVGALSIVRFRTAIKDPMDLLFLFWSIGTGIICGAGLFEIAFILAAVITIGIFLLDKLPVRKAPFLLVVNGSKMDMEPKLTELLKQYAKYYKIKSRNITKTGCDMIIELRTEHEKELIDKVAAIEEIETLSLLSHDGEVRG